MSVPVIDIEAGSAPLIVNVPHDGREVPAKINSKMTAEALALPDTDWHVRDLYHFAADLGATITSARYSRYVVDLNRDPSGVSLYPGADTTEICPSSTFRHEPIYADGKPVTDEETQRRINVYWRPYHRKLSRVIEENRTRFGEVLLFDAHSIGSEMPRFFKGRLPDFNFGTGGGASADADLTKTMFGILDSADGYTSILNGRFKGGYITRHYGDPERGVHAVQLEMAQCTYMEEDPPFRFAPDRANSVSSVLCDMLQAGLDWVRTRARHGAVD